MSNVKTRYLFLSGGRVDGCNNEDIMKKKCPKCKKKNGIPIVYGMPAGDTYEAEEQGEIHLGSSFITKNSPKWHCTGCEFEWGCVKLKNIKI